MSRSCYRLVITLPDGRATATYTQNLRRSNAVRSEAMVTLSATYQLPVVYNTEPGGMLHTYQPATAWVGRAGEHIRMTLEQVMIWTNYEDALDFALGGLGRLA